VGKYLPSTVVDNEYYISHFEKKGIKSKGLFEAVGRDKRHIVKDNEENTFTMGLEAAKNVIAKAGLSTTDFDMLVFVSDSPEFLAPSTAMVLREHLGATNANMVFDMNQSCTGMIACIDVVSQYLKTKKYLKRALLVSSFYGSLMAEEESDPFSYGCLSDGASAVVLEVEESETERGVLDSSYVTDSELYHLMMFPHCGVSKLHDPNVSLKEKKMYYGWESADFLGKESAKGIKIILDRNHLEPKNVANYLVSQFEPGIAQDVSKILDVDSSRFIDTMPQLGYVGNSSPIFAIEKVLEKGVTEGDIMIVSSVGSGYVVSSILYKF
jgi:3-oxoacyl-[acyl-carrier-protein] synthase-3